MRTYKTILDVRSGAEFEAGHVRKSLNIPLDQVQARLDEIKNLETPIVVCCLSGGRSQVVTDFLKQHNIDCFNGGGWEQVETLIQNKELCLKD